MSTRSFIAIELPSEGKVIANYCQWDGYPSHVGSLLFYFAQGQENALQVVKGHEISSLDTKVEKGETSLVVNRFSYAGTEEEKTYDSVKSLLKAFNNEYSCCDYLYLFDKNGRWLFMEQGGESFTDMEEFILSESNSEKEEKCDENCSTCPHALKETEESEEDEDEYEDEDCDGDCENCGDEVCKELMEEYDENLDVDFLDTDECIKNVYDYLVANEYPTQYINVVLLNGDTNIEIEKGYYLGECNTDNWKYFCDENFENVYHVRKENILFVETRKNA